MAKVEYIDKGVCIFCGKDKAQTTFLQKPHTMPRSLGSVSIGVDICDECNHYFGEPDKLSKPNLCIEVCVKEIFGMTKHLFNSDNESTSRLKSLYFEYWHSKKLIRFKSSFKFNNVFQRVFINQFRRGIYEMFLQEYHKQTGRGLESRFDEIRNYARYSVGYIPLYHFQSKNGIILREDVICEPQFRFSETSLNEIDNYGYYRLYIWGMWFYLEVTPRARLYRDIYLRSRVEELIGSGFVFSQCVELRSVNEIDFTLRKLYGRKS